MPFDSYPSKTFTNQLHPVWCHSSFSVNPADSHLSQNTNHKMRVKKTSLVRVAQTHSSRPSTRLVRRTKAGSESVSHSCQMTKSATISARLQDGTNTYKVRVLMLVWWVKNLKHTCSRKWGVAELLLRLSVHLHELSRLSVFSCQLGDMVSRLCPRLLISSLR